MKTLLSVALSLLLVGSLWADPVQEERENQDWAKEVRLYASTQDPAVEHALGMILQDVARLSPHKAHDALKATLAKIDRARLEPEGAVARERLDAPVGNFGEVVPGKVYRGAQPSPQGLRWLKEQGVGTIILLREPGVEETNYPGYSRKDYLIDIRTLGMECVEVPIRDHTVPTPQQIEKFLSAVQGATRPCFFHCSAGIGRTGIMAGLYERQQGLDAQEALQHGKRFLLSPANEPDHALQGSLLANYPLAGHSDTLDLPWGVPQPNPLELALVRKQGWLLKAEASLQFNLAEPGPALTRLADSLRQGTFVRLEFRSPEEVDMLASLARVLPVQTKMGFMKLQELGAADGLTLTDLAQARHLLGPVPFEVRAAGLKLTDLTPQRVNQLADLLADKADVIDLNLPDGANPPEEVVKQLAERGLACSLRLSATSPKAHWDALEVGYLGLI